MLNGIVFRMLWWKKEEIISDDEEDFLGENNRKFYKLI